MPMWKSSFISAQSRLFQRPFRTSCRPPSPKDDILDMELSTSCCSTWNSDDPSVFPNLQLTHYIPAVNTILHSCKTEAVLITAYYAVKYLWNYNYLL